jgi:signal peptidase II
VLIVDQITKYLVRTGFTPNQSKPVLMPLLSWTFVQNTHGAFGLFGGSAIAFALVAALVVVLFHFFYLPDAKRSRLAVAGLAMIAAGAIGNLIDRFTIGYVVDFIDVHLWQYVFNVADSAVTIGVGLLILSSILTPREAESGAVQA